MKVKLFEGIKSILNDISGLPNVFVLQEQEYSLETISNRNYKEYFRYLKFAIVKKYASSERIIYKASCKENNPEEYLNDILTDLIAIKNNY